MTQKPNELLKFLLFLRRIHVVLLFIALEAIAVTLFLRSNVYHKARIVGTSNMLVGHLYDQAAGVGAYFGLRSENERLMEEIARLRGRLSSIEYADSIPEESRIPAVQYYEYYPAMVINNRIGKRENYITINRGRLDGLEPEMALVSDEGIVGYLIHCSDRFSVAVSILNTEEFRSSGAIQGSDFAGSLWWDGVSHREMVLDEVPKYAVLEAGDTIVTTHYSYIFPPDIPIGTVESFELVNGTFYKVRVKLFADMARLRYVYAVRYLDQQERRSLEQTVGEGEIPGGGVVRPSRTPDTQ